MSEIYYQGSGIAFDKYDMSKVGTGDNTHFYAQGHHVSPSVKVAEFYAERVNTSYGGFVTTVRVDANVIADLEQLDASGIHGYVTDYYGNDIDGFLIEHINECTDYAFNDEQVLSLAMGLLTGNEGDVNIVEHMQDMDYTQWGDFQRQYAEHLSDMLYIGHDRHMYDGIANALYTCTVSKFNDDYPRAHEYLIQNMQLDGISYLNYGNNGEQCTNLVVWNDSSMTIKAQSRVFEPHVSPSMRR
jgi:hypothetical protein